MLCLNHIRKKARIIDYVKRRMGLFMVKVTNAERCKAYYYAHRQERLLKAREYYQSNKEVVLERNSHYYESHKTELTKKQRGYYLSHKPQVAEYRKEYDQRPECKAKIKEHDRVYYQLNRTKILEQCKKYRKEHKVETAMRAAKEALQIKAEVLTYYGNGKCACVRCGYDDIRALSIDHINGDGAEHRRRVIGMTGRKMYTWLKRNNYPSGYQCLCLNCQFLKAIENKELGRRKLQCQN
jgi:hypothetical protein